MVNTAADLVGSDKSGTDKRLVKKQVAFKSGHRVTFEGREEGGHLACIES